MAKKSRFYTPRRRKTPSPSPSPSPSSAIFYTVSLKYYCLVALTKCFRVLESFSLFKLMIFMGNARWGWFSQGMDCRKYTPKNRSFCWTNIQEKKYKFSTRKAALEYLETGKIRSCVGPGRNFYGTSPLPSAKRQKVNDSQIGSESSNSFEARKGCISISTSFWKCFGCI